MGYQTGGFSGSGDLPGWRTFLTSEIESVEVEGPAFEAVRRDFDAETHRMVEIFARA